MILRRPLSQMSGAMAVNGDRLTAQAKTEANAQKLRYTAHPIFKPSHNRFLFLFVSVIFGVPIGRN